MSRNPVYASTAGVARHFSSLPHLLQGLTGAGIKSIELGWSPPLDRLALPGGLRDFPAKWLIHNYFPAPDQPFVLNLASQNPDTLQRSRALCIQAIRLCAALKAPFYSVHCGFLAEFDPGSLGRALAFDEICDYERGYGTFLESLRVLLGEARACGIRILVEPNVVAPFNLVEGRNLLLLLAEPREFTRLFAEIHDDLLGVLLDLGHLRVTAKTLGFDKADFIEAVAPTIGGFHLHDNDGDSDQHLPVQAGSWALSVLVQERFNGRPVVVEAKFEGAAELAKHCLWLENLLNR